MAKPACDVETSRCRKVYRRERRPKRKEFFQFQDRIRKGGAATEKKRPLHVQGGGDKIRERGGHKLSNRGERGGTGEEKWPAS